MSLLVQATVGCPHNKCAFCMVYKKGPPFRIRPVEEIVADLQEAHEVLGEDVQTIFLPSANTMIMPTPELEEVCLAAGRLFPRLKRITTYATMGAIISHGEHGLERLRRAGLKRLHVGLESGHGPTLKRMKKGSTPHEQLTACRMALEAGFELNLYVLLGLGGAEQSQAHALATAEQLVRINSFGPITIRLRTLVPKINTLLLHWWRKGRFTLCSPYQVLNEARTIIEAVPGPAELYSDHYTNYINLEGRLPEDRTRLLETIDRALQLPRSAFRADFVGTE